MSTEAGGSGTADPPPPGYPPPGYRHVPGIRRRVTGLSTPRLRPAARLRPTSRLRPAARLWPASRLWPPPGYARPATRHPVTAPPGYPPPGYGYGAAPYGAPPLPPALKPGVIPLRPLSLSDIFNGAVAYVRTNPRPRSA